jgi:hypothetical protein
MNRKFTLWVLLGGGLLACASPEDPDGGLVPTQDSSPADLGSSDRGVDAGLDLGVDAGLDLGVDAGLDLGVDLGTFDAAPVDAEPTDAEPTDAESADAEPADADAEDAELPDVGPPPPGCVPAVAQQIPPQPGLLARADSVVGFSGVQGQCGWHYGFSDATGPAGFQAMTEWQAGPGVWYVDSTRYWTQHQAGLTHPNGVVTTGGRQSRDQGSIRRWQSDTVGLATITGRVRKSSGGLGGNGIDFRIEVDGASRFAQFVAGTDGTGVSFTFTATLAIGTPVDLVLEPHLSDDLVDATEVELRIWQ